MRVRVVVLCIAASLVAVGGYWLTKRSEAPIATRSETVKSGLPQDGPAASSIAEAVTHGGETRAAFSREKYLELFGRFERVHPAANGALTGDRLDAAEELLLEGGDPFNRPEVQKVARDVIRGRADAVVDALSNGMSVDAAVYARAFDKGYTLLSLAIHAGQREIIRILLERGSSPNALKYQDPRAHNPRISVFMPPLIIAAYQGEDDVVEMLLTAGANVEDSYEALVNGYRVFTPLAAAAASGNVSTTYLLLMNGADIQSVLGPDGILLSPLVSMIELSANDPKYLAIRQILLESGAKLPPSAGGTQQ